MKFCGGHVTGRWGVEYDLREWWLIPTVSVHCWLGEWELAVHLLCVVAWVRIG